MGSFVLKKAPFPTNPTNYIQIWEQPSSAESLSFSVLDDLLLTFLGNGTTISNYFIVFCGYFGRYRAATANFANVKSRNVASI
jgi:hypothetical protein